MHVHMGGWMRTFAPVCLTCTIKHSITTQPTPTHSTACAHIGGSFGRSGERDMVSAPLRVTLPSWILYVISTPCNHGMFRCRVIYIAGYSSLGADMPSQYLPLAPHARETLRICMTCPHTHVTNMPLLVPVRLVGSGGH